MKRSLLLILLLLLALPVMAQEGVPTQLPSEDVLEITWPPPVTEVWGIGDVLGTANISNMAYFYLEYKGLSDDLSEPEDAPWLPATPAQTSAVINGALATLDTTTVPDGLYSLRLTANTVDGQTYHVTVSPIRVNNARFDAVIERIVQASSGSDEPEATPVPPVVEPPADNRARVTPSGVAVNVRRCDIVDNDRCPSVISLAPDTFALVTGRNAQDTWYQIRLDSGAQGWVSRTVILTSGDFSSVPYVQPPSPLPPRPQPPTPAPATTVIPNGMSVASGSAVCNQPFNVQVNVANVGNTVSSAGTITLQDVNVRTGTVTFTGYGSYPALNPGSNYVVVIPVTTTIFYNEQHELRAFTNGRQFSIRYDLGQGVCGTNAGPAQLPGGTINFQQDQCSVVVADYAELSNRPGGEVLFVLGAGSYPARQAQSAGGVNWYQISYADSPGWIPSSNISGYQGNCGL